MHTEPSDVMLLVICSETRGEILLRCHCSVKPHTAARISLTHRILWKKKKEKKKKLQLNAQTQPGKTENAFKSVTLTPCQAVAA